MPHHTAESSNEAPSPPAATADGAVIRDLRPDERPYPTFEQGLPLLVEARGARSLASLRELLAARSDDLFRQIYEHGAVLLRGFDVGSAADFEQAVVSIRGLSPMPGYFMSEPGRSLVEGTRAVFETNTFFRTGGDFYFGGFHTENYRSPDVPQFQSFCCFKVPWLGGETALVHMANAYAELDPELRALLERDAFVACQYSVADVASRYRLAPTAVEALCERVGLTCRELDGERFVFVRKPSVYVHPVTGRPSLQVNFSGDDFDRMVRSHFLPYYDRPKWALHKLGWKHPVVGLSLSHLSHLPRALQQPKILFDAVLKPPLRAAFRAARRQPHPAGTERLPEGLSSLAGRLQPHHKEAIAHAIWRHAATFTWRPGDILIFDNLQLAHTGLPGFGPRLMRTLLCNPFVMTSTAGIARPQVTGGPRSIHDQFVAASA